MNDTINNKMSETVAASPFEAASKSIVGNAGARTINSSFDRSMHQPFRLDSTGLNKEMTLKDAKRGGLNVSKEEIKIPEWWQNGPTVNANRTFTDL